MHENFKKFTMLEDQPTTASDSTGNTDGEYTLRIEKEAIAFADSIEVNSIATHTGLVKGYIAGAKELASLREQLKDRDIILKNSSNLIDRLSYTINENKKQLKQKEELILKQSEAIDKAWGAFNLSEHKLKQKEDENRELKDDYKDLKDSIQRYFQTLIARNYNNIGVWSNERQDYNYQLIEELEKLLKAHNNLSA